MHHPGGGDPLATRQSRRGRALLEFTLEHSLRPARHRKPAREDHDRRSGCVHVARTDAQLAGLYRFALSLGITTSERTSREPEPNTGTATGAVGTRDITGCTSGVASGQSVELVSNFVVALCRI